MVTNHAGPDLRLKSSLEVFETCLVSPMMAGELVDWVAELQNAWTDGACQVREHIKELHPRVYGQIASVDPELLPRTEKLRAEDLAIEVECEEFARLLDRIAQHAPQFEPDEEKIAPHTRLLVDKGIELVTRIRTLEAAVQAWFVEAYTRDRGVVD